MIVRDPSPEDWDRLRRYASWMRGLFLGLDRIIDNDTLSRLSYNSPGGLLFPKLEGLHWEFDVSCVSISFFRLFLSSRLRVVILHTRSTEPRLSPEEVVSVTETISCLPTSLERLSLVVCGQEKGIIKDAVSSFACRCGSSLENFGAYVSLSEAAFHHLTQLPNLRSWVAFGEPPRTLPLVEFPSLEELRLESGALPWLHLLAGRGDGEVQNGLRERLRVLHCPEDTPVDLTLLSSILPFRHLVGLYVDNRYCHGQCTFGLTDDNVENLAVTLPSLVRLRLGSVCGYNSCRTTIASLLSISIHCLGLTFLEIHFNTETIVGDVQHLLHEATGRGKPRCRLREDLFFGQLPLQIHDEDVGTIAMGLVDIFPCLEDFSSRDHRGWGAVASKLLDR